MSKQYYNRKINISDERYKTSVIDSLSFNRYKVISLFCGCGGLDLGLIGGFDFLGSYYCKNPFEIVLANDIDIRAIETFRHNFKDANVVCADVSQVIKELPSADIITGGFPCQDFSLAGKQKGLDCERGNLYKSMVKAVEKVRPKVFVAENVKGLLLWQNGLAINKIVNDFKDIGYKINYRLLNMADYGVPQRRERVIIGVRQDIQKEFYFPKQTHSSWITIKQAISDLEDEKVAVQKYNSGYSRAKKNKGQGNKITDAEYPAPTIRAEHHGSIEFHYSLPRRLSAREAARIQSFPDSFEFKKTITDAYKQIGNAVSPVFAWYLAQSILDVLE